MGPNKRQSSQRLSSCWLSSQPRSRPNHPNKPGSIRLTRSSFQHKEHPWRKYRFSLEGTTCTRHDQFGATWTEQAFEQRRTTSHSSFCCTYDTMWRILNIDSSPLLRGGAAQLWPPGWQYRNIAIGIGIEDSEIEDAFSSFHFVF